MCVQGLSGCLVDVSGGIGKGGYQTSGTTHIPPWIRRCARCLTWLPFKGSTGMVRNFIGLEGFQIELKSKPALSAKEVKFVLLAPSVINWPPAFRAGNMITVL